MKKYIIALLSLALLTASCSDYLDKQPEGVQPVDNVDYSKTENMFLPVSGVYGTAATENGFSRWILYGLIAVRADDLNKGGTTADQAILTDCKEFRYSLVSDFWGLNATWEGLYNLVQTCNGALTALDNYKTHLTADSDLKLNAQYQAEVRFVRAYAFFFITRMWGDIPLLLDNNDVLKNPGKNPREDVYKFIDSEMDFCIANLPAVRPNEMPYKGQVTQLSALGLKAKAAADVNNWDTVLSASNDLIASGKMSLYSDFYQYFKKPGRFSDETLYELQYTDVGLSPDGSIKSDNWFAFQGPGSIAGLNPMGGGWGFMTPSTKIVNLFTGRGETVRAQTTFLYSNSVTQDGDTIGANIHPIYNGKAYMPSTQLIPGHTEYGIGNNIRMLRYADILLLNAEAKVRKGQNGDAPLNLVRQRAGMPALSGATLDQILEERQVELAGEWGERYYDLVRTDRAATTLPNFVKGKSEYYPIPQRQIILDPNLK